jgi:hypothetical protein
LIAKLKKKNRKIEELKDSMKEYEHKFLEYEKLLSHYDQIYKKKATMGISTK